MTPRKSFEDRLREHTDTGDPLACWIWGGWIDRDGYGQVREENKSQIAHRVSYAKAKGPIPDGLQLDHLCRTRACVNPAHLEAVTARVNSLRSESGHALNARKTECDSGHEFTVENTLVYRGKRQCRACKRRRDALRQQRTREAAA